MDIVHCLELRSRHLVRREVKLVSNDREFEKWIRRITKGDPMRFEEG